MALNRSTSTPRVLITGAYGLIGNLVYARLMERAADYETYGMVRARRRSSRVRDGGFREIPDDHLRIADLSDAGAVDRAVEGMNVVVHMAADPDGQSGWESVLSSNIVGAHNVFEACRRHGVARVVFASTNQVVFGYRNGGATGPIRYDQPTRPLNYYASSKVFGEALAHMYSQTHGLSCICLRIGWVTYDDRVPDPTLFCSRRDAVQLVERAIEAPPEIRFDVFFGHSNNRPNFVDIEHTREVLGYNPQD